MSQFSYLNSSLLLIPTAVIVGCTPVQDPPQRETLDEAASTTAMQTPSVRLVQYEWDPDSASHDALVDGTLEVMDGCLYLQTPGAERYLIVLPDRITSWDDDSQSLMFNNRNIKLGTQVTFGGGEVRNADLSSIKVPPTTNCDASLVWFVAGYDFPS